MMKKLNNWLDKPLTYREMYKDYVICSVAGGVMVAMVYGIACLVKNRKEKVQKTYETDFEVEDVNRVTYDD